MMCFNMPEPIYKSLKFLAIDSRENFSEGGKYSKRRGGSRVSSDNRKYYEIVDIYLSFLLSFDSN